MKKILLATLMTFAPFAAIGGLFCLLARFPLFGFVVLCLLLGGFVLLILASLWLSFYEEL